MRYIILNLVIVFCTMSCQSSKPEQTKLMQGEMWRVAEIYSIPLTVPTKMHLSEGMVRGQAACNSFFASFSEIKTGFEIGFVASTRKGCISEVASKEEFLLFQNLPKMMRAVQLDNAIRLDGDDGAFIHLIKNELN